MLSICCVASRCAFHLLFGCTTSAHAAFPWRHCVFAALPLARITRNETAIHDIENFRGNATKIKIQNPLLLWVRGCEYRMWHDFSAHHTQRGDVTAVVWGYPGARPSVEKESAAAGAAVTLGDEPHLPSTWKVDAEALTRGRRAGTPFVQQCDLIFPLPDRTDSGNEDSGGDAREDSEAQAEVQVVRCIRVLFCLL